MNTINDQDYCDTCHMRFPTNAFGMVLALCICSECGYVECGTCRERCREKADSLMEGL